jgi:hypothetical protein
MHCKPVNEHVDAENVVVFEQICARFQLANNIDAFMEYDRVWQTMKRAGIAVEVDVREAIQSLG